ncbi:sex-lethal homolog isoform X1 [Artemia franciscana]|uniref:sex-lethal homolog isoform X1 n=1 Tax=Artemia franciscana TaxID=6661 RepID=UPI0032DBE75C
MMATYGDANGPTAQEIEDHNAKTNLIINYLPQTFVDADLRRMFSSIGEVTNAKVMRDKKTGYSYGFGFVNYSNIDDAKRAIEGLNGLEVQGKRIKVSYARPPGDDRKDTNLYVTHLPKNMTDAEFAKLFEPYGSIIQSNLLRDKNTGLSRGVGFVRYDNKDEAAYAIQSLDGTMLPNALQPLSVKIAEEHGKMKASYFAGMQAGKTMAMGHEYGGYGGYATGGYNGYNGGYGSYDVSGYSSNIHRQRMPISGARPGLMGPRPSNPMSGMPRPPPIPAGGPMKSRMQNQKRYNPMGNWDATGAEGSWGLE